MQRDGKKSIRICMLWTAIVLLISLFNGMSCNTQQNQNAESKIQENQPTTEARHPESSSSDDGLTLIIHPFRPPSKLIPMFKPFTDYLGNELGIPVYIKIGSSYDEHICYTGSNKADLAYMGPVSYIKLIKKFGPRTLLARLEVNGKPTFSGKIIVKQDSPIQSLEDLKHLKFAFGEKSSTMSYIVPYCVLMKNGIACSDFSEHEFLGSHDNVALAVLSGDFDAGAVKEGVFLKYKARGLRVLVSTPEISEHVFVASDTLSPKQIERIKSIFYSMNQTEQGAQALKRIKSTITGLVPVSDSDYDNLRDVLETVNTGNTE